MKSTLLLVGLAFIALTPAAFSQSIAFDTGFGQQGLIANEIYPSVVLPSGVMPTADRIYTLTQATQVDNTPPPPNSYVKCYNLDGSVQTSFGTNGIVTIENYGGYRSVIDEEDGKIFCIGASQQQGADVAVVVTSDQTLIGQIIPAEEGYRFLMGYIFRTADNKVVIGGYHQDIDSQVTAGSISVIRLDDNLNLDPTFGNNGIVILPEQEFMNGSQHGLDDMEVDMDGNVYLIGRLSDQERLIKLNNTGVVDPNFSPAPEVATSTNINSYYDIHIQDDGKVYIAPIVGFGTQVILRLNSDGSLDNTFSDNGIAEVEYASTDYYLQINKILVDDDQSIYAIGNYISFITQRTVGKSFAKFDQNGQMDTGFGVTTLPLIYNDITNFSLNNTNVAFQPDGKILCFDFLVYWDELDQVHFDNTLTRFTFTQPESVADLNASLLSVFPNPASNQLNLDFGQSELLGAQLNIYDQNGKLVQTQRITSRQINVENLSTGLYSGSIQTQGIYKNFKFYKNN
jgi:uncharacterized delta-60 repeat protein